MTIVATLVIYLNLKNNQFLIKYFLFKGKQKIQNSTSIIYLIK